MPVQGSISLDGFVKYIEHAFVASFGQSIVHNRLTESPLRLSLTQSNVKHNLMYRWATAFVTGYILLTLRGGMTQGEAPTVKPR